DAHGHAAGDEVLRAYAANVLSILRHHDLVARYGGEEFAVLLPNTSLDGAVAALTKVRNQARTISCRFEGKELQVPTFSAGLTLYAPGDVDTTLVDRADRALYRAKRLGRNRSEVELSPATRGVESIERAPAGGTFQHRSPVIARAQSRAAATRGTSRRRAEGRSSQACAWCSGRPSAGLTPRTTAPAGACPR